MNEVPIWILVFLQSLSLVLQVAYFIVSILLRLQALRRSGETDDLIRKHLKEEEEL